MTYKDAIDGLAEIEAACKKLRRRGFQAGWFGAGMKGLEGHAKGLRCAIESIAKMTGKISQKEK